MAESRDVQCVLQLIAGELDEARLKSYQKLRTEADYAAGKTNYLSQKEKKFKTISKINKSNRGRH